jgi:hypothetical protein
MAGKHWSDDELVSRLYGVGPEDSHLEECEDCAERWRQLLAVRERVLSPPQVSEQVLAQQRRAIYERLEPSGEGSWGLSFAPALAVAMMLLLAFLVSGPSPSPQPSLASTDAQFFEEVYSLVENVEPQAIEPILGLFEVEQ